jgi:quercetin dioxygenase-like cupin family protein
MITFVLVFVILISPVFYNLVSPFKKPKLDNYFSPGQTYYSKGEGITQTITKQEDNKVYCEVRFEPFAAGPPEHLHLSFDETATVTHGTLTAKIGSEIQQLKAGDRLIIPKGTIHRIYNETKEPVIIRSEKAEDYLPVEFAYALAQLYPLMEKEGKRTLRLFAKICVLDRLFDSIPAGPPPAIFGLVKKIVKPYARIFGVTPYDQQ